MMFYYTLDPLSSWQMNQFFILTLITKSADVSLIRHAFYHVECMITPEENVDNQAR